MPKRLWIESNWAYMPLWDEVRSYLTLKEVFQTRLVCKSWSRIKHIPLVFEFEDTCPPEDAPLENLQVIHYCGCANKFEENGSVYLRPTKQLENLLLKCHRRLRQLHIRVVGEPEFIAPILPKLESLYVGCDIGNHVASQILNNCPNLEKLWVKSLSQLDFAKFPYLKEYVTTTRTNFTNIQCCNLQHIFINYNSDIPLELLLRCRRVTLLLKNNIDRPLAFLLSALKNRGSMLSQLNFRLQSFEFGFEINCNIDAMVLGYKPVDSIPSSISTEQIEFVRSQVEKKFEKTIHILMQIFPVEYRFHRSFPEYYRHKVRKLFYETCCGDEESKRFEEQLIAKRKMVKTFV